MNSCSIVGSIHSFQVKVVRLLDNHHRDIQLTSVDLVRFCWEEQTPGGGRKTVTTRATVWVGVLPDSTTGDEAFESTKDILQLLRKHDIYDVDVAYRESMAQPLTGPALYAPVNDLYPLKAIIDSVTLCLPIAGLQTLHMQGTLGFYFKVDEDRYGITARHVLFPAKQGNVSYEYITGPKKDVVLMGNKAFDDLLRARLDPTDLAVWLLGPLKPEVAHSYD